MKQYVIELTYRDGEQLFYGAFGGEVEVLRLSYARHFSSIAYAAIFLPTLSNFKPVIRAVEGGVLTGEVVV